MMPRSHFVFGVLAGAVASLFFVEFTLWHILLAGVLAVLVDIDHFLSHMFQTGDMTLTGMWKRCMNDHYKKKIKGPKYRSKAVHGWQGFIALTIILAGVLFWKPVVGAILFAAYYSHVFADWFSGRKFYGKMRPYLLDVKHLLYPVYFDELIFDVFVFDLAMIILLYRGLL